MFPNSEIIKEGIFLHDNVVDCDIRIFKHDFRYGSGDYEDPLEICDDIAGEFYYVEFGSTKERGKFVGTSEALNSLEDAIKYAESVVPQTVSWKN